MFDRLDQGALGRLTVVTGAPGTGKTTTVSSWAAFRKPEITWLSCNAVKTEGSFWRALAARGVRPSPDPGTTDAGDPLVLVLDDLAGDLASAVGSDLALLVEQSGHALRLVLIAREDPPLPLQRYKLAGELTEICGADLAFTKRETAELLLQHHVRLPAAQLARLCQRTEGWAAGLRLAAMSMEDSADPASVIEEFGGDCHALVAYLSEEVLADRPAELRRALLAGSIPERINTELLAELGDDVPTETFSELTRRSAFIQPSGHGWYRYQQLFREALQVIFQDEDPQRFTALHRRAARWFGQRGMLKDAVHHAARARDSDLACQLVVRSAAIAEVAGLCADRGLADELTTFLTAGDGLDETLVRAALALSQGDQENAARALGAACRLLDQGTDAPSSDGLAADVLQLVVMLRDRPRDPALPELTERIEETLGRHVPYLSARRPELNALAGLAQGSADLWAGRFAESTGRLTTAVRQADDSGSAYLRKTTLGHLALAEAFLGRFNLVADLCTRAKRLPVETPQPGGRVAIAHIVTAWSRLQMHDVKSAERELALARPVIDSADPSLTATFLFVASLLDEARDHPVAALDSARQATRTAHATPWLAHITRLLEARLEAAMGSCPAALDTVRSAGYPDAPDTAATLAHIHLLDGDVHQAGRALRPILTETVVVPAHVRVEAWLLDAYLAHTLHDASRTRRSLDRALRLGQRESISLPFARSKGWLYKLLRSDPELSFPHRRLLQPIGALSATTHTDADPDQIVEPLSGRELDVLRHLAEMMTTQEIADELTLSVNTIKTHLKGVYRKLGVTRRGEAVRRAQALSIL